ncbi:hypothetical protein NE236_24750 [Actinoallomurus purpureus]|uniref:hypothetical protein n=1 Tax=Actinoallomurus purpureus TaxID=478114 RepID=UPI00209394AF|nr:hypothetical protein [Actinoallomurus purpureus]MCO6008193.1 hypothetical protein [Actinoallomurus purpureus]
MNRTLGRRVATAAATLAVAGGAALAVGGTASAASIQDAHRTTVSAYSSSTVVHSDNRDDDRYRDHGDARRWDERRWDERRWDDRRWERVGHHWYGGESRRYRVIGHRLYYWNHGTWRLVTWHTHGRDVHAFR